MYSVLQEGTNLLSYLSPKFKEFENDTFTGVYTVEFLVMTVLNTTLGKQNEPLL